jgi:DNA-binding NarL/FixJ family response regulator
VVIYSQFPVTNLIHRVPEKIRSGWSFFDKSAAMELEDYVAVLEGAASGKGNWEAVADRNLQESGDDIARYFALSARQRNILMLTAEGKNTKEISAQMGITYEYARKELSRAYAILVPEAIPGGSLKAAAIAKYLQIMRMG